jgi:hypothetical protein
MKKAFIVTSGIEINGANPLTYSQSRSYFSNEERLRQTVATIASVDQATDDETTIYLVDISDNWQNYQSIFSYQKNLKYVSVKNEFPEIFTEVTTHPQKSRCECLTLATFMQRYKQELKQYDFLFKFSGRYLLDRSFDISLFNESNQDKLFYKKPLKWEWNDSWGYSMVDLRKEQNDNYLNQYSSVLVGWTQPYQDRMVNIFNSVAAILSNQSMYHYDVETLSYYFARPYASDIIETDWKVYGWLGTSGQFVRY